MNIAKLNTASLDDKTFIIKRGTSGGGSDTPSGGSNIEYFKYSEGVSTAISTFAQYVKITASGGQIKAVMPYSMTANALITQMDGEIIAYGLNLKERTLISRAGDVIDSTIEGSLMSSGITQAEIDAIPRLTKEQFYSLE